MKEFCKMPTEVERIIEILKKQQVDYKKNNIIPKAVLLGGLPGAGKTALCKKVLEENKEIDYVVIDVDEYRKYSPIFSKSNKTKKSEMIGLSCDFANNIASKILEYSLKNRKNIIINTSLRETELIMEFINNKFIPNNYNVEVFVIITPIEECIISSQERYEKQIEEKEFPRFTTIEFIRESQVRIYETVKKIEKIKNINKINLYIRGKNENELPIKVFSSNDKVKKYRNVMEAIEGCEKNEYHKKTNEHQLYRINQLYKKRKKREAEQQELDVLVEMMDYYKKLNKNQI